MALALGIALAAAFGASPVHAGLEEIDHVVLFMQENRAFNHVGSPYFLREFNSLCSISEPWLAYEGSMILMSKSTRMDSPCGIS